MAKPWRTIDSVQTDEGLLVLRQRGDSDFLITIDGRVLMNGSGNLSEMALAHLACAALTEKNRGRVLVGGLGMGFTLKAALERLPAAASVTVAELNPVVVDWCRGPMAQLAGKAVDDPRVTVVIDDVAAIIRNGAVKGGTHRFNAIILDLYEGPHQGDHGQWEHLYGRAALAYSRDALLPGGVLAIWSEDPDTDFEKRLCAAGFTVDRHRPGRGGRHVVYIAVKTAGKAGTSKAAAKNKQRGR